MTAIALSVMAASLMVAAWMIWPTGWRGVDRSELANLATSSWEDSAANERWRPFQHQAAAGSFIGHRSICDGHLSSGGDSKRRLTQRPLCLICL